MLQRAGVEGSGKVQPSSFNRCSTRAIHAPFTLLTSLLYSVYSTRVDTIKSDLFNVALVTSGARTMVTGLAAVSMTSDASVTLSICVAPFQI